VARFLILSGYLRSPLKPISASKNPLIAFDLPTYGAAAAQARLLPLEAHHSEPPIASGCVMTEPLRRPFSPKTLAERWSCTDQHIRNLITTGRLPGFRLGKLIRIRAVDVDRYEAGEFEDA
jgi:excisionase family DNA binding protein